MKLSTLTYYPPKKQPEYPSSIKEFVIKSKNSGGRKSKGLRKERNNSFSPKSDDQDGAENFQSFIQVNEIDDYEVERCKYDAFKSLSLSFYNLNDDSYQPISSRTNDGDLTSRTTLPKSSRPRASDELNSIIDGLLHSKKIGIDKNNSRLEASLTPYQLTQQEKSNLNKTLKKFRPIEAKDTELKYFTKGSSKLKPLNTFKENRGSGAKNTEAKTLTNSYITSSLKNLTSSVVVFPGSHQKIAKPRKLKIEGEASAKVKDLIKRIHVGAGANNSQTEFRPFSKQGRPGAASPKQTQMMYFPTGMTKMAYNDANNISEKTSMQKISSPRQKY